LTINLYVNFSSPLSLSFEDCLEIVWQISLSASSLEKFIVEFLKNIKNQKIPAVVKNQRDLGLDFHLLDLETIKEISEN